jgi:hypothetical protein
MTRFKQWWPLLLLVLVTCGLRLYFVAEVSQITPFGDAARYWNRSLAFQRGLCERLLPCPGDPSSLAPHSDTLGHIVQQSMTQRPGITPALIAIVRAPFGESRYSWPVFLILLEALIVLMLVNLAQLLGGSRWAGWLAGWAYALYIPAIVSVDTTLQQAPMRFGMVVLVWAYSQAFLQQHRRALWMGLGTLGTSLMAFSNQTMRPMLWFTWGLILLMALAWPAQRRLLKWQLGYSAALLLAFMLAAAGMVQGGYDYPSVGAALRQIVWSDNSQAGVYVTTPLSYAHFWPNNPYERNPRADLETPPSQQLREEPLRFTKWWLVSIYSNWIYPDYIYLQTFLLDIPGQIVQHQLYMLLGLLGIFAALTQPSNPKVPWLLILLLAGYCTLVFSLISVEPRRLGVLMPFICLGLGGLIAWLAQERRGLGWLGVALILLSLPFGLGLPLAPGQLLLSRALWVGLHGVLWAWVLWAWLPTESPWFWKTAGVVFALGIGLPIVTAQLEMTYWSEWQHRTRSPIEQTVRPAPATPGLYQWLLVDMASGDALGRDVTIELDGRVLKPLGQAMFTWDFGLPNRPWQAFTDIETMANASYTRRRWLAWPLDHALTSTSRIRLIPSESPITLYGDYHDPDSESYLGPTWNPSVRGASFWRWNWNARDERIPMRQALNGWHYESGQGDLASQAGYQSGLYRVFVVEMPFPSVNNALFNAQAEDFAEFENGPCPQAAQRGVFHFGEFSACIDDAALSLYQANRLAERLPLSELYPSPPIFSLVAQVQAESERLDVFFADTNLFVLNVRGEAGQTLASYTWKYPPDTPDPQLAAE